MSNSRQQLAKAYELIRQERIDDAMALIKPITEAEPENADAWWLLANASSEPRDARRALITVLKLNPAHPKARQLLDQLNDIYPPRDDELMQMMDIEEVDAPLPTGMPEADFIDDPFEDLESGQDDFKTLTPVPSKSSKESIEDLFSTTDPDDDFGLESGDDPFASLLDEDGLPELEVEAAKDKKPARRRRLPLLIGLLMLCLVCVVVAVVFGGGGSEPTEVAPPLSSWAAVAADAVKPENATALEDVRLVTEQDARQFAPDSAAQFILLSDGAYGLVIRICSEPSPQLPLLVRSLMDLVAIRVGSTPAIQPDLGMVGVTVEDCLRGNDVLYRALSPLPAAITYSASSFDEAAFSAFRQTWVVEG